MENRVPFVIFQPFAALLELCSFSSFHRPKKHLDQPGQALLVQRRPDPAEESTLTTPDRLSSIGSQSRMKKRVPFFLYFYHLVLFRVGK